MFVLLVAGCGSPPNNMGDPDLAGGGGQDLAAAPDLAENPQPDLAKLPDLKTPPDLTAVTASWAHGVEPHC